MNRWIKALKAWNAEKNPGAWCVPKKGSPEHAEVVAMMGGGKASKAKAHKEAMMLEEPKKKSKIRIVKELPGEKERKREAVKAKIRRMIEKLKRKEE